MLRLIASFFNLFEAPKTYVSPALNDIFSSPHAASLPFTIQRLGGVVWEQHHYHAYRYIDGFDNRSVFVLADWKRGGSYVFLPRSGTNTFRRIVGGVRLPLGIIYKNDDGGETMRDRFLSTMFFAPLPFLPAQELTTHDLTQWIPRFHHAIPGAVGNEQSIRNLLLCAYAELFASKAYTPYYNLFLPDGDTMLRFPKSWSDNPHLGMLYTHYLRAQAMTSNALSDMDPLEL